MRSLLLYGIGLGAMMSSVSWFANLWASAPNRVSVFPDLLTLVALPVLVFLALRSFAHQDTKLTRANLRRAGTIMVSVGATLFALALAVLGVVRFSQPSAVMFVAVFAMAFAAFLAVGWPTSWAASTWLTDPDGGR